MGKTFRHRFFVSYVLFFELLDIGFSVEIRYRVFSAVSLGKGNHMSDKKYLISVITPFHNTSEALFKRGFESLKRQTIGFENIEWIVVVHNSEKKYHSFVKKHTASYENIQVLTLDDEYETASSPRNHALMHAGGKYVAFMDSDDYFMDDGLKIVSDYLEKTKAEVASFRAETKKEDDSIEITADMRTAFDQTTDCILIKKGNPEIKKLVSIAGLSLWCYMIRKDLIDRVKLRFDMSLRYREDSFFCLTVLIGARSVAVLPRTIAYVHYLNHAAVMQNHVHSRKSIMEMERDVLECVSLSITNGIGSAEYTWSVLGFVADAVESAGILTAEDKAKIAKDTEMILDLTAPIGEDTKFHTSEEAVREMARIRRVLLGEYHEHKPTKEENLQRILNENKGCELGRKYGFSLIRTIEEYQERVPVSCYEDYAPYIELTTRVGETDIFCEGKVSTYVMSYANNGNLRLIPQTEQARSRNRQMFLSKIRETEGSTFILFESMTRDKEVIYADEGRSASLFGESAEVLKGHDVFNSHKQEYKYGTVTSPYELMFPDEMVNSEYATILFALADKGVSQIVTPFTWNLLELMQYLEHNWKILTDDLEKGKITGDTVISPKLKKVLNSELKADPERAEELRQIFKGGFENVLIKIWPDLKRITAAGTGKFAEYKKEFKHYSGDIPLNNGYIVSAESVVAAAEADNSDTYVLLEDEVFLEFILESGRGKIVPSEGVKPGKRYEIIITNQSGFYRYRTGDVIEVERIEDGKVYVKYCYRLGKK